MPITLAEMAFQQKFIQEYQPDRQHLAGQVGPLQHLQGPRPLPLAHLLVVQVSLLVADMAAEKLAREAQFAGSSDAPPYPCWRNARMLPAKVVSASLARRPLS